MKKSQLPWPLTFHFFQCICHFFFFKYNIQDRYTVQCPTLKAKSYVAFMQASISFLISSSQLHVFGVCQELDIRTEHCCDNRDNIRIQSHSSVLLTTDSVHRYICQVCWRFSVKNAAMTTQNEKKNIFAMTALILTTNSCDAILLFLEREPTIVQLASGKSLLALWGTTFLPD